MHFSYRLDLAGREDQVCKKDERIFDVEALFADQAGTIKDEPYRTTLLP